jgi:starvation-inducible DNA-binding protein
MQPTLYDLIALGRVLKQLHWNVIGINFWPIHLHLDEIYGIVEEAIDEVAERLVATGHSPSGRLCDVTKNSDIEDAMAGFIKDSETVTIAAHAIRRTVGAIRDRMTEFNGMDAATADMLHQISLQLEKQHWMLEAQRVSSGN